MATSPATWRQFDTARAVTERRLIIMFAAALLIGAWTTAALGISIFAGGAAAAADGKWADDVQLDTVRWVVTAA